jgi:acyl-CoA reductase-like NAD-dependent aldehyde dehydrogenase
LTPRTDKALEANLREALAALLGAERDLRDAIAPITNHRVAVDEVNRSAKALAGALWEVEREGPQRVERIAVFLPSNNALYSYVLFGLIPALYCEEVVLRPSQRISCITKEVHCVLQDVLPKSLAERLRLLHNASQREFVESLCYQASAVVFTGQPENARSVAAKLPSDQLFLAFGSGPNPLVIGERANPQAALSQAIRGRLYNAGQDCLCSDVIFVNRAIAEPFIDDLVSHVAGVEVLDRDHPEAIVTPLVYQDAVEDAADFIQANSHRVLVGGRVNRNTSVVEPTVIETELSPKFCPPEFFSPVFLVAKYDDWEDVQNWLQTPREIGRGMYLSLLGVPDVSQGIVGTSVVCHGMTPFDVEDGNRPFGGFGTEASAVSNRGEWHGRPLLLSAEIASWQRR